MISEGGLRVAGGSGLTRGAISLTHRSIETMRPADVPYRIKDQRCFGLAVRVAPSGVKTWDLAFRIRGSAKVRRISLGRVTDISLEAARERAAELTRAGRTGRDLIEEERSARAVAASQLTIGQLIAEYTQRRVVGRLRTAPEIERRLKRALGPVLHRLPDEIRRRDIRELLDAAADQGIVREAEKRRQTIGAMFKWANSQDLVDVNPAIGLAPYHATSLKDRVLSADEVARLWHWLQSDALPRSHTKVLRLQVLTGARCGELGGMAPDEIDTVRWIWTLPAARSKNGKPRVTPLVGLAREIVRKALTERKSRTLFGTGTGNALTSSHIGTCLLARRARLPIAAFTTHDLRRTVVTMLVEMGVSLDIVAAVVGHEAGGRETRTLIRHYVRTDLIPRKREILLVWDEHIKKVVNHCQPAKD
jgi:integrase